MRQFSLIVFMTALMASLPGLPLPTRSAAAGPPKQTCEEQRKSCRVDNLVRYVSCLRDNGGDCDAKYDAGWNRCERGYLICSGQGGG